jgi:hypothetical protein
MSDTKTIKLPLWDGVNTSDLIGQRIFESVAEEITLADTLTDEFDDSSLDSTCWIAITTGGGTVSETTQLDLDGSTAADASAVVYKQNPADLRSRSGEYKAIFKLNTAPTDAFVFGLLQKSGEPVPGAWNSPQTGYNGPHAYRRASDGKIVFRYIDTSEVLVFLDYSFSLVVGTTYVLIFEVSGSAWRFVVKNAGETVTHVTTPWVNWSDCYDNGDPDWIYLGDMLTTYNHIDLSVYQVNFLRAYASGSPSPGEEWNKLPVSSIVDMSTVRIPEMMNSGDSGSIKYQHANNGGALNGTWLTQAQIRLEADVTISDSTKSIKIVPQYISNGTQRASSQAYALVDVQLPYSVFQLPMEVFETGDMEVIEL